MYFNKKIVENFLHPTEGFHQNSSISGERTFIKSTLSIIVLLQGAYLGGGTLKTTLSNSPSLIPLSQPYYNAPWYYNGTESISPSFQARIIVDWILVQIVSPSDSSSIVFQKAGILRYDGRIVETDLVSPLKVTLPYVDSIGFDVVVRHRNHLSIRTPSPIIFQEGGFHAWNSTLSPTAVYTNPYLIDNFNTPTFNSFGVYLMWAGDVNSDGKTSLATEISDRTYLINSPNTIGAFRRGLGGSAGIIVSNVYSTCDTNFARGVRTSGPFFVNSTTLINTVALKSYGSDPINTVFEHV